MSSPLHVAVVGGGAAGLVAAIAAARAEARVTLLERQERVGRKLLATGNGRCNLTNLAFAQVKYHGDRAFAGQVLARFSVRATLAFFSSLGACTTEEEGRVYPLTGQASTVLDVLRFEVERLGVDVRLGAAVEQLSRSGGAFSLVSPGGAVTADRVVVATGGKAAPQLGGTGDGVELMRQLGHSVVPLLPGLVPVKTAGRFHRQVKGVRLLARAELTVDGEPAGSDEGEVQLTEYGLSGIPILQLSLAAGRALAAGRPVAIDLDLFPAWSHEQLARHLGERFAQRADAPLELAVVGLVHKRLIPVVLREGAITDLGQPAGAVSTQQVARLAELLKRWRHEVTGTLSWNHAQVMAGGVSTRELDPASLESRLVPGLFAAGELLDVTGDCGGYNLQWAWSSGHVAGLHAATA